MCSMFENSFLFLWKNQQETSTTCGFTSQPLTHINFLKSISPYHSSSLMPTNVFHIDAFSTAFSTSSTSKYNFIHFQGLSQFFTTLWRYHSPESTLLIHSWVDAPQAVNQWHRSMNCTAIINSHHE